MHAFPPEVEGRAYAIARPVVTASRAVLTVDASTITTRLDQTFYNNNSFPLKALYLLEVPSHIDTSDIRIRINGLQPFHSILSPDTFFPELENLTVGMRDPSLLGLAGRTVVKVEDITLGVKERTRVEVEFEEPKILDNDLLRLTVPMAGERYALAPVAECSVHVRFKTGRAVRSVFSPSHGIRLFRESPERCTALFESVERSVRDDFKLIAGFGSRGLNVRLITHRPQDGQGTFLTLIEPPAVSSRESKRGKDVVFLLDCSSSMSGKDLARAKKAVIMGLERLTPDDRFNVLAVSTRPKAMAPEPVPVKEDTLIRGIRYVESLGREGGTDLYNSLMNALDGFTLRFRSCVAVLVSDGRSTVGVTDPLVMLEDFRNRNRGRTRLFAIAVGKDADVAVLDKLTEAGHGALMHYSGDGEFESKVTEFLSAIAQPIVSRLSLDISGPEIAGVLPNPLPDMFHRRPLGVVGQYRSPQTVTGSITLKARFEGDSGRVTIRRPFPLVDPTDDYVPGIHAMRRLAGLLENMRLRTEDEGIREDAEKLARRWGIAMPMGGDMGGGISAPTKGKRGEADLLWLLKTSFVLADVRAESCRNFGDRVLCFNGKRWMDTRVRPSDPVKRVEYLSREYFAELKQDPTLGACFALGPRVTVRTQEGAVAVVTSPGQ